MSDMHTTVDGNGVPILVMHFEVPNKNNSVQINLRTALKNSRLTSTSILKDGDGTDGTISSVEKQQLADGEKIEVHKEITLEGKGSSSSKRRNLKDKLYDREKTAAIKRIEALLKFFGDVKDR